MKASDLLTSLQTNVFDNNYEGIFSMYNGNLLPFTTIKMEGEISTNEASKLSQQTLERFDSAINILNQFGSLLTDKPDNFQSSIRNIYSNYGGNRQDAEHIVFANAYNLNNILTNDVSSGNGFLRYPSQNIFGLSKNIKDRYNPNSLPNTYTDIVEELEKKK